MRRNSSWGDDNAELGSTSLRAGSGRFSKCCSGFRYNQLTKNSEAIDKCKISTAEKQRSLKAEKLLSTMAKSQAGIPTSQRPLLKLAKSAENSVALAL